MAEVYDAGKLLGSLCDPQAGNGPFYLVVAGRYGRLLMKRSQVADRSSVKVTTA
jgi:hypothetical protein